MNKKFWMLIVTGAVIAAGVTATGCAAQKHIGLTTAPAAIEITAETKAVPAETGKAPEEQKHFIEEKAPVEVTTAENKIGTCDGDGFTADPVKETTKAAKKASAKKTVKTAKKSAKKNTKKTAVNNERALIVKAARAEAVKDAAKYQNMNEKIAAAKQASAKKAAAQKNADSRKNMNKAAEEAQKAAKTEAEKQHVKKITQKAETKTAAEKIANAKKAAAKKAAATKREVQGAKKHAKKCYERTNKRLEQTIKKLVKELYKKNAIGKVY